MPSEWDDHLRALGLTTPDENASGTDWQLHGPETFANPQVRDLLFAPAPEVSVPSALHRAHEAIAPTLGTASNLMLATAGAPPLSLAARSLEGEIASVLGASKLGGTSPKSKVDEMLQTLKDFREQAAKAPSEAEVAAKLAKDPGASIFDVLGVSEHPSSPLKSFAGEVERHRYLGSFPSEVPFEPSELARSQGYVTPAAHGTRLGEQRWVIPGGEATASELGGLGAAHEAGLDALRLPEDELGVHFGTPEQAHHFTAEVTGGGYLPRTYPTVLQTGRSLEVPDAGTWEVPKVHAQLDKLNEGRGWGVGHGTFRVSNPEAHVGEFPAEERAHVDSIEQMRDYLRSKGYDSVNYINTVEGPGQRSYIMFQPSPVDPRYVAGVRSPFAQFDPEKLASPLLAAGLAGGILASPLIFDEQGKPFVQTR